VYNISTGKKMGMGVSDILVSREVRTIGCVMYRAGCL
jgi:hypothetical protein